MVPAVLVVLVLVLVLVVLVLALVVVLVLDVVLVLVLGCCKSSRWVGIPWPGSTLALLHNCTHRTKSVGPAADSIVGTVLVPS